METTYLTYPHDLNKDDLAESVAAIGFFDGVHKGHQKVINRALKYAKENDVKCKVITFHPHPSVVLNSPNKTVQYITPLSEKVKLLKEMGVEQVYVIKFNKELSLVEPKDFIDHFIVGLNIIHLVAVFDYSYGHKVENNEEKISSTKIRNLLAEGKIKEASNLLGRPFSFEGKVVDGDKRGRLLGYPTANIETEEKYLLPRQGIYAVRVHLRDKVFYGMANLGLVPTFIKDMKEPKVEVYIF